ncbi:hypothetical protein RvY_04096 [Ramazzottius varieornatus]|uniref:Fatty acid synthase n=1 Tax=Ramazzottius varieornatus TaxID=947166 RepID=A0A1D1UQE0_RAMVA|nr:hypothetical protein RvY_04096 [Ramazzottius varieornatus]
MVHAQENSPTTQNGSAGVESPDDIVISGMSIRCSQSDNIEEFAENLYNGVNMVHENLQRCDEDHFGVPKQHGFIKDIRKFDATFFGVHPKQAEGMDPQLRILHEVAYESIIDAGIDPAELKNSNTGVFIGTSNSDAREAWTSVDVSEIDGYSLIGTHRAFLANRLSFTFDLRGPSYGVDAACATSGVAINQGFLHIKHGVCEAALVGGVSLVYQPKVSYQILKLGLLCKDGMCKVFDEAADGYVRAEAIVCIMLQKRKDARRVYATLLHSKINNDGFKEQGITFPCTESQGQLIREVYAEAGIDPEDVEYVEAHGTGTKIGDPQETNGIALGFANTRTKPLPIGAVKSNMGHSEHASGAVSVCKIMIAMQTGIIPPNLHYKNPNPLIPALVDGRLKVVTEPFKWDCTLAGINCFGFGGQNSHLVVRGNPKTRDTSISDIRLAVYMGRTEEAARHAMEYINRYPDNPYVPYLLMQSAFAKPASMPYRAYTITNSGEPQTVVERVAVEQKPVWWIFSGQGTQWASMGQQMVTLDFFRKSIDKCAAALTPYNLDLVQLLSTATEADYDDPTISFVGIAAIQVALVDLLQALKINAEGFIGHSAGEIGCAYADGCFTAEEAVLTAYWRGRAVKEAGLAPGAMAAVGLSAADATEMCKNHPQVNVACNNAEDNVTISGPADAVNKFVEELKAKNIFAKEVKSYGIAFHSPAMQKASPIYLEALKKTLTNPKSRTDRWLSSSVPESDWNSDLAKTSSAEYFAHNLRTTVKFHEVMVKIPKNAICIEIAPHGLLQALIKKTVGPLCTTVALMKRGASNNVQYFLESIGKLYVNGLNPHVNEIFPKPSLPAPRDTPFIGSVVRWDHSAFWRIPAFTDFIHKGGSGSSQRTTTIDLTEQLNARYHDHKINQRSVFPIGGLISVVAKAFAVETGNTIEKCPQLEFSNVNFPGEPIELDHKPSVAFNVNFVKSTGYFEVLHGENVIMTGYVGSSSTPCGEDQIETTGSSTIDQSAIYQELAYRGYDFGPLYQVLDGLSAQDGTAIITARHHETAIDGLIQLHALSLPKRQLARVTNIQSMKVNFPQLAASSQNGARAQALADLDIAFTPGLEMEGITWTPLPTHSQQGAYILKEANFVPFDMTSTANEKNPHTAYAKLCSNYILSEASRLVNENKAPKQITTLIQSHQSLLNGHNYSNQEIKRTIEQGDAGFLQLITSVFSGINGQQYSSVEDMVKKTVPNYKTLVQNDAYLAELGSQKTIAQLLELAVENFPGNEVKVLELVQTGQEGLKSLSSNQVHTTPNVTVEYKTVAIKSNQSVEIEPASASVLVAKNYFTQGVEAVPNQLRGLSTLIANDGYLMVVQPLEKYASVWNFFGAFGEESQKSILPGLTDFAEALAKEGFQVVAAHRDGLVSSTLLCRKMGQSTRITTPTVVPVPQFRDQKDVESFLDDVSEKAQQSSTLDGTGRVWLTMPTFDAMVVDAVVARNKDSNGGPLRVAVSSSGSIPREIIAVDLLVNVEHHATWGTYRTHVATPTTKQPATLLSTPTQPLSESDVIRPYATAAYGLLELAHAAHPVISQAILIHADACTFEFEAVARVASVLGYHAFVVGLSQEQARLANDRLHTFKAVTLFDSPLTTSLVRHITKLTNGQGVDIVYNATTSSKLRASSRLLQKGGVYLEPNTLTTEASSADLHYALNHRIVPYLKFASFVQDQNTRVNEFIATGLSNGAFLPLPPPVISTTNTQNSVPLAVPQNKPGSFVVFANDEENIAAKVAYWLASQGATTIHFVTFSPNLAASTAAQLRYVESTGAKLVHHVDHPDVLRDVASQIPVTGLYILNKAGGDDKSGLIDGALANTNADEKMQQFVVMNFGTEKNVNQAVSQQSVWLASREKRGRPTIIVNSPTLNQKTKQSEQPDGETEVETPKATLTARAYFDALNTIVDHHQHGIFFLDAVKESQKKHTTTGDDDGEGPRDKSHLPQTVAKIMGIKDFASLDMFLSLGDYGIDSLMAMELGQVLERDFDLSLTLQEIRSLCVRDVCLLSGATNAVEAAKFSESHKASSDFENPTLLENVNKHYNLQEIVPKTAIVPLSESRDSKVTLFIVHPMEGTVLPVLATLANHLQVTAYGLNCTKQADISSTQALAESYLKEVKKIQPEGPYNLAGYSFGAGIAFEMALQLQESNETVSNLILLDGSHSFVAAFTKTMKAGYTVDPTAAIEELNRRKDNAFQNAILTMFVTQFVKTQRKTLQEKLAAATGFEAKTKVAIEELHRCPQLRHIQGADFSEAANLFAQRLIAADTYKPARKYTGKVTLIKCSEKMIRNLGEVYELDKVCTTKLNVSTVTGNHEGFVLGDAARITANHINTALRS